MLAHLPVQRLEIEEADHRVRLEVHPAPGICIVNESALIEDPVLKDRALLLHQHQIDATPGSHVLELSGDAPQELVNFESRRAALFEQQGNVYIAIRPGVTSRLGSKEPRGGDLRGISRAR